METASGGYTVIEVMIVLGITTLLFFSAIQVFSSERSSTDFSQSMQDLNSKIENYANQVVNSTYPGSDGFSCIVSGGHAALSTTSPGAGSDCLFLGLAIQALAGEKSLQTYTVLGNKDIWNGSDTGLPALNIDGSNGANPEPAIADGNQYVLMDTYRLGASSSIVSAKSSGSEYDLLGMYNGLTSDTVANSKSIGALALIAYPCNDTTCLSATPSDGQLKACIEEASPCATPPKISQWQLCIQGGRNQGTALLTVDSAPGGITSHLSFAACS